jgi:hypothetical protein
MQSFRGGGGGGGEKFNQRSQEARLTSSENALTGAAGATSAHDGTGSRRPCARTLFQFVPFEVDGGVFGTPFFIQDLRRAAGSVSGPLTRALHICARFGTASG